MLLGYARSQYDVYARRPQYVADASGTTCVAAAYNSTQTVGNCTMLDSSDASLTTMAASILCRVRAETRYIEGAGTTSYEVRGAGMHKLAI